MSLYCDPFVSQIQKWVQNESLIPLSDSSAISKYLGSVLTFKSTIEPKKPRLCLNARPLAGVLKKLPCRLNQLEELLPHLQPNSRVIISDDSSGFLHVFLHPEGQRLCGIHLGEEFYAFRSLPFGIPSPVSHFSAPSIYQSCNNVISTLLRQFLVPNCLYIDDRCIVLRPGEEYLGWVLPALCTATGHYLSVHKANLSAPAQVFTFLGFEVDIPKRLVRVPEKRKIKIRALLAKVKSHPICDFHDLEKLRGKLCSLNIICPLTRLYIRESTRLLSLSEGILQPDVMVTPELFDELTVWEEDPYFIDCERDFDQVGELDFDFSPSIKRGATKIEYHTDSSGYRMGVYDCQNRHVYSRQLSEAEVNQGDIAIHEARALLFCIQNINLRPNIRVVRLHCDNLICVHAMNEHKGCRKPEINAILKELISWQRKHQVLIEVVYIPTRENQADAPSRQILFDEIAVTNGFLRRVEKDLGLYITLDGASHAGLRLNDFRGHPLPYCARYNDGSNSYLNFLNLDFEKLVGENVWLFCPKNQESRFLRYYLTWDRRPNLIFVLLQHNEADNLYPLLMREKVRHIRYANDGYLTKAVKNRYARITHNFHGMRYVHPDGGIRRGRTLGENDFQIQLGNLQHRLMYRPSPLIDRHELVNEITIAFLLDLLDGLEHEEFVVIAPYRFLKLPTQKIMLSLLEGAIVLIRDRNREIACRLGMAYCAFLDGCRYYQPVTRLIMFCLGLGLGNSSSEALFHGGRYHERYQDVLLPGGAFWDENHPTDVAQLFVCHSIVERFKLENLYQTESAMVSLPRIFARNESSHESFSFLRPLFLRGKNCVEILNHIWPLFRVPILPGLLVTHPLARDALRGGEKSHLPEVEAYLIKLEELGGIPFSVRPSRHLHLENQAEQMLREIFNCFRERPPYSLEAKRDPFCDCPNALKKANSLRHLEDHEVEFLPEFLIRFKISLITGEWRKIDDFAEFENLPERLHRYRTESNFHQMIEHWDKLFFTDSEREIELSPLSDISS